LPVPRAGQPVARHVPHDQRNSFRHRRCITRHRELREGMLDLLPIKITPDSMA
jgi:hypothetical protein